jgi:hypothetical protein
MTTPAPDHRIVSRGRAGLLAALLCAGGIGVAQEPGQWRKERDLLAKIEQARDEQGALSTALVAPLLDLGLLYVSTDRCEDAIGVITQALGISRAADGLFNLRQLELLDPLFECYLALDLQRDLDREVRYTLLLGEQTFGRDDARLLPAIDRAARWYEQAGRYISARKLHTRGVWLAERAGGKEDLRLIGPLRGIARAYRLEYVHGLHALDLEDNQISALRSRARLQEPFIRLDQVGTNALRRAEKILRRHPDAGRALVVDTLLDLGDWYQTANARRDAMRTYKAAWVEAHAPGYDGEMPFAEPRPVVYRTSAGVALRRPPARREGYRRYWVEFEFTVTRAGLVEDIEVLDSDASRALRNWLREDLQRTRYRPRFVAGEPVDTPGFSLRQGMYLEAGDWRN